MKGKAMEFVYSEDQLQLRAMIKKFVDDEVAPAAPEYDKKANPAECIAWPLIEKALSLGIGYAAVPREYGGTGLSTFDMMIIAEELARGDAGLAATVLSNYHGAHIIAAFGTPRQKDYWLPEISNDTTNRFLMGFALTEPQSGADAMSSDPRAGIQLVAERQGDAYVLNGRKCFITNGGIAKTYLVWTRTDKTKGAMEGGLSAFIVPAETSGLAIGRIEDKLGQRLSQQAELIFEDCRVPAGNILAGEGMGFPICFDLVAGSFTSVGAIGVGIAVAAFEAAYAYATQRVQGGTEIINHQAISHKLANMLTMIEATRTLVQKSAYFVDKAQPNHMLARMCKLLGSELAFDACNDALQICGGYGYTKEYPVEKLFRDSRVLSIYEAGNETHRTGIVEMHRMIERMQQSIEV